VTDIAVVTGAGSGIGRAVVECLSARSYSLVAVDRDEEALAVLTSGWRDDGLAIRPLVGDVADRAVHEAALTQATELGGRLAAWINCAGVTATQPLHTAEDAFVGSIIATNQLGTFWGCVTAVGRFLEQNTPGAVVNVSSVHGRLSSRGHAVYEMTKGAVEALTRNIAVAYGPNGIRANAVAPGAVATPALEHSLSATTNPAAARGRLEAETPLRRLGRAHEVANVVAFLLSAEASYVNGQTLLVDGGWSSALSVAGIGWDSTEGGRAHTGSRSAVEGEGMDQVSTVGLIHQDNAAAMTVARTGRNDSWPGL
jgi:NAD(P)-dependent dehydrogenase (short-subunit alcohol dehydrogenase family)